MNASTHRSIHPSAADFLPPEAGRSARPPLRPVARRSDVVDAVFETVTGGARTSAAPAFAPLNRGTINATAPGPLALLEGALNRISIRAFVALTGTLCLLAFLLGGQISTGPAAALRVEAVESRLSDENGLRVVSVYGAVINDSGETRRVPAIQVDLAGPAGLTRVEGQFAGIGPLSPGETRRFTARLPHAGGSLPQVEVSLAPMGAPAR